MAINVERQRAFSAAFNQYPDILEAFVKNNVGLVDMHGNPWPMEEKARQPVMELMLAQFIARLFQTRAKNTDSELMETFASSAVGRYRDMTIRYIGALSIVADDKYRNALLSIEQNMANLIFEALMQEAEIDEVAEENGNDNRQFDEADFWHDVMLGLGSYYRKGRHPHWWRVTQTMYIDHKDEFRKAIADENRLALENETASAPEARQPSMVRH